MRRGAYQLFMWGWVADYPDPENFLFLLWGESARSAGGPNTANFADPEYDRLFLAMRDAPDDPERLALIRELRAIVERERPWIELFYPESYALVHGWVHNAKPLGMSFSTLKYRDVDVAQRTAQRIAWNRAGRWPAWALAGGRGRVVLAPGGARRVARRTAMILAYLAAPRRSTAPSRCSASCCFLFVLFFLVTTPDDIARRRSARRRRPRRSRSGSRTTATTKPRFWNPEAPGRHDARRPLPAHAHLRLRPQRRRRRADHAPAARGRWARACRSRVPLFLLELPLGDRRSRCWWRSCARPTSTASASTLCVLAMSVSVLLYIVGGQYLLGKVLRWFPISGFDPRPAVILRFLALPVAIGVIAGLGEGVRFYRTVFVEEVGRDHVRTARAKGCGEGRVMMRHVLRNALIPILTQVVVAIPFLFTGSLLLESFFGIPGLGVAHRRRHQRATTSPRCARWSSSARCSSSSGRS